MDVRSGSAHFRGALVAKEPDGGRTAFAKCSDVLRSKAANTHGTSGLFPYFACPVGLKMRGRGANDAVADMKNEKEVSS